MDYYFAAKIGSWLWLLEFGIGDAGLGDAGACLNAYSILYFACNYLNRHR